MAHQDATSPPWKWLDRAYEFEPRPNQRYRVDADELMREPGLVASVCGPFKAMLLLLDIFMALTITAGIFATCTVSAWMIVPTLLIGWAVMGANRRTAARLASALSEQDPRDFAELYRAGVISRV